MGEKLRTRFLTSMKCFNLPGESFMIRGAAVYGVQRRLS